MVWPGTGAGCAAIRRLPVADTLGSLEMELYKSRPDLWGISKALKFAPGYKRELLAIISESDRQSLLAYSDKIRAVKAQIQASKR